jgi:hypothetical protein
MQGDKAHLGNMTDSDGNKSDCGDATHHDRCHRTLLTLVLVLCRACFCCCRADEAHPGDMTDRDVDKLIVVTSAKKGAKQVLDQQLIDDGLALYQEQLSEVRLLFKKI